MDEKNLSVGQLAKVAGVNTETVRYYHRIGLLSAPKTAYGSIRRYGADDVRRLRFIKRSQRLGFALEEVSLLLALEDGTHCAETKVLAEQKLEQVKQKIDDLAKIETDLRRFIDACAGTASDHRCPMIGALVANA